MIGTQISLSLSSKPAFLSSQQLYTVHPIYDLMITINGSAIPDKLR